MGVSESYLLDQSMPAAFIAKLGTKLKQIINLLRNAGSTDRAKVVHNANASSQGTPLYVNPVDGVVGKFESDNAGGSDSYFKTTGGEYVVVFHNDSPSGYTVHFDETNQRFVVDNTLTGTNLYVRASSGRYIELEHVAGATTTYSAVYFDDDAADADERLLFVSASAVGGTVELEGLSTITVSQLPDALT